jgi:hypothetical protein
VAHRSGTAFRANTSCGSSAKIIGPSRAGEVDSINEFAIVQLASAYRALHALWIM